MKQISLSVIANIKMPKGVGATLNRLDISVMDKYTIKKKKLYCPLKKNKQWLSATRKE